MIIPRIYYYFGLLAFTLNQVQGHYKCWACTYIFAGHDGSQGYDCVDKPANFSNSIQLECHDGGKQCVIDAVYDSQIDPPRLLSMDRGCRAPTAENGCSDVSARPRCTYSCDSNLCNDLNGDLKHNIYYSINSATSLLLNIYIIGLCSFRYVLM